MAITYNNLYLDIRQQLHQAGLPAATLEARELVCCAAGKSREELSRASRLYVPDAVEQQARAMVQRHLELGEIDEGALRVCRQNIRRTGLSGQVVSMQLNALEKAPPRLGEFDCIVSNPPYIPDGDIAGLDPSVRDYEPRLALKGGADGLDFYRAICENWRGALRPGGRLYFEVGIGQADDVLRIMRAVGFGDIEVIPDLNGIPRVVWGILHTEI